MRGMEGKLDDARRPGSLRPAALIFSAYLLCPACMHQARPQEITPEPAVAAAHSEWRRGTCDVSGSRLSYTESANGRREELVLDTGVTAPVRGLSCSEQYTVVMESGAAVISLGANGVLGNIQSLGCYGGEGMACTGGRFIAANSIEVSFREIRQEDRGILSSVVEGDALTVRTASGRVWSLQLSNPFAGWSIY